MVWTRRPVTTIALSDFAKELGVSWTQAAVDEVAMAAQDARVYVSRADAGDRENVLSDDVEYAAARMGTNPASMLSMRIGHGKGSAELAAHIAERAIQTWDGFLDRNEPASE